MKHRLFSAAAAAAALLCLAGTAAAHDPVIWSNVINYPDDLVASADAWSAIRVEDPGFVSFRIACDDFELTKTSRLSSVTFYGVAIGDPVLLGADWYIFENTGSGTPGRLLFHEADAQLNRTIVGLSSQTPGFGPLYMNEVHMGDLLLPKGRYFIAFRTFQTFPSPPSSGKNNNTILTTRVRIGQTPALWNFGVRADGTVTDPWQPMEVFTLTPDHEWAFTIEGKAACLADCDGSGTLNIQDFTCFQNAFALGDVVKADCTGDGTLNIQDFTCFQNTFALGCP